MFKFMIWLAMMLAVFTCAAAGYILRDFFRELIDISLHCELDDE